MTSFAQDQMRMVANTPAIIGAVIRQIVQTTDLSEVEIIALDDIWRGKVVRGH